jgi:NAD(P)-dependent dehydrogenase (short-subunit alcohol dehydrogenase family)
MSRLDGRVALVTGAGQGIGAAIAAELTDAGALVVLCDRNREAVEATAARLPHAEARTMDVARVEDWDALRAYVHERHRGLHVLVNNAGIVAPGRTEDLSLDDWHRVHRVNVDGVFLGTQAALRLMRTTPPVDGALHAIVNMSSVVGIVGTPHGPAYPTTKAAVRHFTKCVALECAALGLPIRVNSVHPGLTETPMQQQVLRNRVACGQVADEAAARAFFEAELPLGRLARPIDVARAVRFLAGPDADFMTGSELVVDGGLSAG